MEEAPQLQYGPRTNALKTLADKIYMHELPSYGNKIFYGLGFLALTSLAMLVVTGFILAFLGQAWWLGSGLGVYVRSVHLWSVQALIAILILHGLVGFTTSGFRKPRRMVWVFGALMFCLILITTEFGYGLRGDFSSQFRATSGADFWNGSYLGWWVNPLSHLQEYAIHIAIIPILIFGFFVMHYLLERTYGIAKPYRNDIQVRMVSADHTIMYVRGATLVCAIFVMAFLYHSPYVPPIRISDLATQKPSAVETALMQEFDRTSKTATYLDSIDPYTFDTRQVFVTSPYEVLRVISGAPDAWQTFRDASAYAQSQYITEAETHFGIASASAGAVPSATPNSTSAAKTNTISTSTNSSDPFTATPVATGDLANSASSTASTSPPQAASSSLVVAPVSINPVIAIINALMPAAQSGMYESLIDSADPAPYTYSLRFLSDMGAPEDMARTLNFATDEWGMAKDETGHILKPTPGSWWFLPLAVLNTVFDLPNRDNGDKIAAESLGLFMLIMVTFPYIPYLNRLPELLHLAPIIWKDKNRAQK